MCSSDLRHVSARRRMPSSTRTQQDARTPFPTWYGEEKGSANPHKWCAYHAHGAGAWVAARLFARHGRAGRRACTECAGPGLRGRPSSDAATLEQCDAFASCLSERRHNLWRRKGFDGAAAAEALRMAIGDPEGSEESEESDDDGGDAAQQQQAQQRAQENAAVRAVAPNPNPSPSPNPPAQSLIGTRTLAP